MDAEIDRYVVPVDAPGIEFTPTPSTVPFVRASLSAKPIAPVQPLDLFQQNGDAVAQRRQHGVRASVADRPHELFPRQRQRLPQFRHLG